MPRRYKRSETDFLKLKKHDNPETNTEKFDIENYLNGNWDKIDENVGEVNTEISNIKNEIAKLETELKEAQEDFYQNSIRGQASGEYIHVEDSSNCRAKIGISGNSEQETRSGKNYLNTLAKYKAGEKVTVDGITYIFNEDGSITCNGTATADSVLTFSSNLQTINGSGKKIVGMITGTQVPAKLSILAYTSDWSKNTAELLSSVNKNITINMQENIDYAIFRIIVYKETTLNNQTIYYQILDTSVNDLTYEQYGASPSPNYLSEVKCVGSNINILPSDLFSSASLNGINYTNKDGIITVNGTATENSFYAKTITLKAGTYTLNGAPKGSAQDKYCLQAQGLGAGDFGSGQTFTIDTEKQVTLRIMVWKGITVNNIIFKPKLIKGTEVGEYSKYGQGCVKATKCNKNLFVKDNITLSEKSYNLDDNGELISQGSWRVVNYIKVKPNTTYTLSGVMIPNKWTHRISEYDAQLIHIKQNQKTFDGFHTFTTSSTTKYIRFNLISGNNGFDYDLSSIQLEENKEKTTLEQHEEQSYIMPTQQSFKSVRDIRDTFIKKDGKWYERHNINRRIFDGTTNKFVRTSGTANNLFVTNTFEDGNIIVPSTYGENVQHFNNYFQTNYSSDGLFANGQYVGSAIRPTDDMVMGFGKESEINTVDEANAWLKAKYDAGAPLYVDYLLETPIDIECTEEQSKILDELNNARTYKNVTNITTDSKAILSLDYAKDQETQNQKIQNEIDEIKQLLSTTQTSALLLDNMQTDIESEVK